MQASLFDFEAFISFGRNDRLAMVLEALPAEKLLLTLEREHWTGRKGYSVRGMWSALIAGFLRQRHSIAEVARLLEGGKDVRIIRGFAPHPNEVRSEGWYRRLLGFPRLTGYQVGGLLIVPMASLSVGGN